MDPAHRTVKVIGCREGLKTILRIVLGKTRSVLVERGKKKFF